MILLSQQGSGSRFLTELLCSHTEITRSEEICNMGLIEDEVLEFIETAEPTDLITMKFRHLELYPNVIEHVKKNEKVILLKRDPCHTFTRDMAKYKEIKIWTRANLVEHVQYVLKWYKEVEAWNTYTINYEEFGTIDKPLSTIPDEMLKQLLEFIGVKYKKLSIDASRMKLLEHII